MSCMPLNICCEEVTEDVTFAAGGKIQSTLNSARGHHLQSKPSAQLCFLVVGFHCGNIGNFQRCRHFYCGIVSIQEKYYLPLSVEKYKCCYLQGNWTFVLNRAFCMPEALFSFKRLISAADFLLSADRK